jgi:hypothetical protein
MSTKRNIASKQEVKYVEERVFCHPEIYKKYFLPKIDFWKEARKNAFIIKLKPYHDNTRRKEKGNHP